MIPGIGGGISGGSGGIDFTGGAADSRNLGRQRRTGAVFNFGGRDATRRKPAATFNPQTLVTIAGTGIVVWLLLRAR